MNKGKIIINGQATRGCAVKGLQNNAAFTRRIFNSRVALLLTSFLIVPLLTTTVFGQAASGNVNQNTNQQAVNKNNQLTPVTSGTPAPPAITEETVNRNTTGDAASKNTDWHSRVVVKEVYNIQYRNLKTADQREAGLNDIITVVVENLEELLKRSKCDEEFEDPKICRPKDIVLYINGREIKGLQPESGAPSLFTEIIPGEPQQPNAAVNGELRYHLQRITDTPESNRDNSEHWSDLLGLRLDNFSGNLNYSFDNLRKRKVEMSVGLADDYPVRTDVRADAKKADQMFWLIRLRGGYWFGLWFVIMLAVIAGLVWLAIKTDLLKDRAAVLYDPENKPYSLSAFQAAWWFAIVLLSFIFIWLVTGQNDFSPTALILLGIGLGTTLGANLIDVNKRSASSNPQIGTEKLKMLLCEKEKLEKELNGLPLNNEERNAKDKEYQAKILEIRQSFPNAIGPQKKGFFRDILSDTNGVSFHRFQLFVWTIILGLFFIVSALGRLAMPQFSETLLALLGISAGAFLGFKGPENNNAASPPNQNSENIADDVPPNQLPGNQNAAIPGGRENALPPGGEQPSPVLCVIEPAKGSVSGGAATITETDFDTVTSVKFGDAPATDISIANKVITFSFPPHAAGAVKVTVENNEGKTAETVFTYE